MKQFILDTMAALILFAAIAIPFGLFFAIYGA